MRKRDGVDDGEFGEFVEISRLVATPPNWSEKTCRSIQTPFPDNGNLKSIIPDSEVWAEFVR